ncbi:MAG: hypothetical protein WDZ88_03085 [Candidatus Paceibacterota bacterium]
MQNERPEDNIERIKRKLYSPQGTRIQREKTVELHKQSFEVPEGWQEGGGANAKNIDYSMARRNLHDHSLLKKLLLVAVVFFCVAVGIFSYLYFGGLNTISSQNVDISIVAPVSVGGGEELPIQLTVTNRNAIPLESVLLTVEFPEGTRSPTNLSQPLLRYTYDLGGIQSGDSVNHTVDAILFGEENSIKNIKVSIEYRVPDSSARLYKEKMYEPTISSSPILVALQSITETSSGKEFEMTINVSSNSNTTVEDLLLRAEYPFGYQFVSASPEPDFDDNVWQIGDLRPEQKKTITIRGSLTGEDGSMRAFNFSVGSQGGSDEKNIGIPLISRQETIEITRPFIGTSLALNGNSNGDAVIRAGQTVRGDITYVNNLPTQVTDVQIEVKLAGSVLDRRSVSAGTGFYRSIDDTIVWEKSRVSDLATLNPGENGTLSFSVSPVTITSGTLSSFQNPEMSFVVSVKGTRVSESNVPEEITSSVESKATLSSNLSIRPRLVYSEGPFVNTGPVPPKVETETVYTVYWTITNTTNDVSGARVTASLPFYARWVGQVSPPNERVTYNQVGSQIVWDVGDVSAGSGILSTPREVAFQVAILPSLSQVGVAPNVIGGTQLRGFDTFTETTITADADAITTQLSSDPVYGFSSGRVVE